MKPTEILHPEQRRPSKAELRKAVYTWRDQGYPNTTPTTKRLFSSGLKKTIYFWKMSLSGSGFAIEKQLKL